MGDTAVSPDTLLAKSKLKVPSPGQISIGGMGYSRVVKTQSAKFWPNFNGGGGDSRVVKIQSAKFWPNFNFWVGEGVF